MVHTISTCISLLSLICSAYLHFILQLSSHLSINTINFSICLLNYNLCTFIISRIHLHRYKCFTYSSTRHTHFACHFICYFSSLITSLYSSLHFIHYFILNFNICFTSLTYTSTFHRVSLYRRFAFSTSY